MRFRRAGGRDTQTILKMVNMVVSEKRTWNPPAEYLAPHVAGTVARIVLGYRNERPESHTALSAGRVRRDGIVLLTVFD